MRRTRRILAALATALVLTGCSGSDGVFIPVPNNNVDFNQFVQDQIAATADDTDPVAINNINFQDVENEDEGAFANLVN